MVLLIDFYMLKIRVRILHLRIMLVVVFQRQMPDACSRLSVGCHDLVQGVADGWRATAEWVAADGKVNLTALEDVAKQSKVMVTDAAR